MHWLAFNVRIKCHFSIFILTGAKKFAKMAVTQNRRPHLHADIAIIVDTIPLTTAIVFWMTLEIYHSNHFCISRVSAAILIF